MDFVQGKGFPLIGFLFYGLMVVVGRPGYRIDCRTIKGGGSQVSNLIIWFVESSNIACLHHTSCFLFGFLLVRFGACGHLLDKLEFIENGVHTLLLLRFRCWRFYQSYSRKGSHHFLMGLFYFLLIVFYIKIVLALVASFPTWFH